MSEPRYWMNETSGILSPVIERYVNGSALSIEDIAIMRAYLKQWIYADVWSSSEEIKVLRREVHTLLNRFDIDRWLHRAEVSGIDPL